MRSSGRTPRGHSFRIRIEKPLVQGEEAEGLLSEAARFSRMVPQAPNPNLGRVKEIKDQIRKGNYLTPEVLEETAAHLTLRFMRSE